LAGIVLTNNVAGRRNVRGTDRIEWRIALWSTPLSLEEGTLGEAREAPGEAQVIMTLGEAQVVRLQPEVVMEAVGEAEEEATAEERSEALSEALTLTGQKIKRGGRPCGS